MAIPKNSIMPPRPQTSAEFDLLAADASRGVFYPSFQDFWDQRLEPLQLIGPEAQGVFAALRSSIIDQACAQWALFELSRRDRVGELDERKLAV